MDKIDLISSELDYFIEYLKLIIEYNKIYNNIDICNAQLNILVKRLYWFKNYYLKKIERINL